MQNDTPTKSLKIILPFDQAVLESLSKALGDTAQGLTGSEIEHALRTCQIDDVSSAMTKWKRIYDAFATEQTRMQRGNRVIGFIRTAMNPARWTGRHHQFEWVRSELNKPLLFAGMELRANGDVHRVAAANTLTEAEQRAKNLRITLESRGAHADLLLYYRAELLTNNYFHAVLEASKSIAAKLRSLTGLKNDGADLVNQSLQFGKTGQPLLAINSLKTDTEKGEQRGFANLLIGFFGTFRNPTAHAAKIDWPMTEQDALVILGLVSLLHRKLDAARLV